MHIEKIKIFDDYFRKEGYKSFQEWFEGSIAATEFDTMIKGVFSACDLVQKEQQNRIAENYEIDRLYGDFNDLKNSILSENNLIK